MNNLYALIIIGIMILIIISMIVFFVIYGKKTKPSCPINDCSICPNDCTNCGTGTEIKCSKTDCANDCPACPKQDCTKCANNCTTCGSNCSLNDCTLCQPGLICQS
jgi:hypothetical protein